MTSRALRDTVTSAEMAAAIEVEEFAFLKYARARRWPFTPKSVDGSLIYICPVAFLPAAEQQVLMDYRAAAAVGDENEPTITAIEIARRTGIPLSEIERRAEAEAWPFKIIHGEQGT